MPDELHVTNGDSAGGTLREAGLGGDVLPWRDVLHEGPVLADGWSELREVRARFLSTLDGAGSCNDLLRTLEQRDQQLLNHDGDFVLWFEADLYDQLQLIQILCMLAGAGVNPSRVSLVQIGEYPGIAHFHGIGQLTAPQLAGLYPGRWRLDRAAFAYAQAAWHALTAPAPERLAEVAASASTSLRFVAEAFARLMQEYPWHVDGLGLIERRILAAVHRGITKPGLVFKRVAAQETRPYLGDTSFFRIVAGLAPLLTQANGELALTDAGREVLLGAGDHVRLNAPRRWLGGVEIGAGPDWRYDERLETIARQG
ncbi:MAG TPA: DUF1835 domain-containing protein [Chloroflexota bacterium]|nr:DUF1835 domain-containing protein [Chloroflexota bacterium]